MPEICRRCGTKTTITIMSIFNTDTLCMPCKDKERNHPKYEEAREADNNAVKRGDYNFPGIGLPSDLR